MWLLEWLGFSGKERKIMRYDLDPNSIKENNIIKGQANQIAELQGALAKAQVDKAEQRQLDEQKQDEERIKHYLQNEKKQLNKNQSQKFFSLKAFFTRYLNDKKFQDNLKVSTFDRANDLATFGDFGFSGNQFVILNNKNKPIIKMRELKDIFQSVDALSSDMKSMKIPINLDKEGGFVENLMLWEAPEIIREEDGFKYSKARKRPFYELLAEKDAQIQQGYSELEESEATNTRLQDKVDELEIVFKANEKSGEISRAERVKTTEKVSNIEKMWGDTESELTKLRQIQVITEDNVDKLENQLKIMRDKAEGEETKLSFEKALEEVERIRSTIVRETPEKEVETKIMEKNT